MRHILTADERIISNTLYQLTTELNATTPLLIWGPEHGRATVGNENDLFVTSRLKEVDYHFPEHVASLITSLKELHGKDCRYASVYKDKDGYEVSVFV